MRRARSRGFTLLEVLAALTLFALVAAAATALATGALLSTAHNRQATFAVLAAQQELEALRSLPYDDVQGGTSTVEENGVVYTVATDVVTNAPTSGVKRITVTVSWNGIGGVRSYVVDAIFTSVA